jgi:hypothetical protein
MILQLGGLTNLIIGITTAEVARNSVDADNKNSKFYFWYQWPNSEVSSIAWRNLKKDGYKHYSP